MKQFERKLELQHFLLEKHKENPIDHFEVIFISNTNLVLISFLIMQIRFVFQDAAVIVDF